MIRSRLLSARRVVGLYILCSRIWVVAPRCGRPSVGLRAGRPFRLGYWGVYSDLGPLGRALVRLGFWLSR